MQLVHCSSIPQLDGKKSQPYYDHSFIPLCIGTCEKTEQLPITVLGVEKIPGPSQVVIWTSKTTLIEDSPYTYIQSVVATYAYIRIYRPL